MPTNTEMYLNNVYSYQDLMSLATKQGLDNATFNTLIWGLLDEYRNKPRRTFSYGHDLAAAESACQPAFVRSFSHIDWVDGASVVQAEQTSLEEGFNLRFHRIENDFDALKADVVKLFHCLADLRAELSARLGEVKAELNRINSDIADCCGNDTGTVTFPPWHGGYVDYPPYQYPPYQYPPVGPYPGYGSYGGKGPVINPADWVTNWGGDRYYGRNFRGAKPWIPQVTDITDPYAPMEFGQGNLVRNPSDPDLAILAGMRGRRIDIGQFNGKNVEVWSTPAGMVMTPLESKDLRGATMPSWLHPEVDAVGQVVAWGDQNAAQVDRQMDGEFTVGQLNEKFGEERLGGGVTLGMMLSQLPTGTKLKSVNQLGPMLIDRAISNIKLDRAGQETVVGLIGLGNSAEGAASAPVTALKTVSPAGAKVLEEAGVRSLAELAKANTSELSARIETNRGGVTANDVAQWGVQAQVALNLIG